MALTNAYCSLAELKARLLSQDNQADTTDDSALESVINAASRVIDRRKNRRFYTTTSDETRYFTAKTAERVVIDDLLSMTTLKTDFDGDGTYETTWATTDYQLFPLNTTPRLEIRKRVFGSYYFPLYDGGVQIVGKFGYSSSAPDDINELCILLSLRIWKRKDLVFGVSGSADMGTLQAIANAMNDGELKLLNSIPDRKII